MTQEPKKIILFSRLFMPHVGGVEKHVFLLSQQLQSRNYKVTVVTERFDKKLKKQEVIDGIKVMRIPISREGFYKKFEIWKWIFKNKKILEGDKILHVHDVFFWLLPYKILHPSIKIYTTFHGYEGYPIRTRWIFARKLWEVYSRGTICIGEFMKKWYKTNPMAVSYGAVASIASNRFKTKKTTILFYGRLDEQTNIKEYVGAYKKLHKKHPKVTIRIIGEGKYSNIANKVVPVLPFDPNAVRYLPSTRFVFTSRYLSILEALLAKKLTIAYYDNPVKRDYLKMTPFKDFIEVVGSEKEVVEKVEYYLSNPEQEAKKTQRGYEWAKSQTWEKLTDLYVSLWRETLIKE